MKKKRLFAFILILVIAISVFIHYRSGKQVNQPQMGMWVKVETVGKSSMPITVRSLGSLTARRVAISPEIAGHVEKIYFADGQFIKKNAPLIQLNDAIYKAKYDSAVARLAFSENDYHRKTLLGKKGVIAQQAIDQANADLQSNKASKEESAVMVNKMLLTAPFDGVLGKCKVNRGDYVTTGQNLVTLTDTKHLHVEYNVPESWFPLLKVGQKVRLYSAAWPDRVFIGKVAFISPTVNDKDRSVSLYADVDNSDNALAVGMFVNVKQTLAKQQDVIMVAARSLVPVLEGQQVYKVKEGKAWAVNVSTGKRQKNKVQILAGLQPGDVIITDGQQKVRNGMPVKVSG